jgi:hypothetical protein
MMHVNCDFIDKYCTYMLENIHANLGRSARLSRNILDNRYSTISSNNQIAQPRTTASRFESQPQFTLNLIVDLKLIVSKINVHYIVLFENYNFYY